MYNEVFLIHKDDYINHIDEKVLLYMMVQQLTYQIGKLPETKDTKALHRAAKYFDKVSEEQFNTWGIPGSYLVYDNKEALSELMESELIAPEDAGYVACNGVCCCGDCGHCCMAEAEPTAAKNVCKSDDSEDVVGLLAVLYSVIDHLFDGSVTVHIAKE